MKRAALALFTALFLLAIGGLLLRNQAERLPVLEDAPIGLNAPNEANTYSAPISPVGLDLFFAEPPNLDEAALLVVQVHASIDAPGTLVSLDLPEGVEAADPLEPLRIDVLAGETRRLEFTLTVRATGDLAISAEARYQAGGDNVFGETKTLYLDSSPEGIVISSLSPEAQAWDPDAVVYADNLPEDQRPELKPYQPSSKFTDPNFDTGTGIERVDGTVTIYGYFYYSDTNKGVAQPLREMRVEIWDDDDLSPDDKVDTVRTDLNGRFETTVSNSDEYGGLDIFVKAFATDDHAVHVTNHKDTDNVYQPGGDIYRVQTNTFNNVPDGLHFVGYNVISNPNLRAAYFIADVISQDAFDYLLTEVSWDNNHNLEVRWTPVITDKAFYSTYYDYIHLGDHYVWFEDVILHEFGHFTMDKFYPTYPPTPNCEDHTFGDETSLGCAWSEGWATFLAQAIQGDRTFRWGPTSVIDLENPSPFPTSTLDEGSVAASLWDIYDPVGPGSVPDKIERGIGAWNDGIWEVFSFERPNQAYEFFDGWNAQLEGDSCSVSRIFRDHAINVTEMCPPRLPPTNITASDGTRSDVVEIEWQGGDGTHYEIYRAASAAGDKVLIDTVPHDSGVETYHYEDADVIPERHYWYSVRVCNSYGCSFYSYENEGWRGLEMPGGVSASDGSYTGFVRISWEDVAEADAYRIYRAQSETGEKLLTGYTTELTWDTDLVPPGTLYYFWVQPCTDYLDCGAYSTPDSGWRALQPPGGMSASDGSSSVGVDLSWSSVEGAQTYQVYRSTTSGVLGSLIATTSSLTHQDTTAAVVQQYFYSVKACGQAGLACSDPSSQNGGWRALNAPEGVQASDGGYADKVRVSWNNVAGATSYKIYQAYSSTNTDNQIGETGDLYFDHTGVSPGIASYYWIKACTASSCSPYSAYDTGGIPPSMSMFVIDASDGGFENLVRVEWGLPVGTTSSQVYRSEASDGVKDHLATVATDVYSDTTALYGTTYYYWVKACNAYGCGDYSGYNSGWADAGAPQNLSASDAAYSDQVEISWDPLYWATYYEVYRASTADGAKSLIGSPSGAGFSDILVSYKNTYYYWVKACNTAGCSDYSQYDSGYPAIPVPQGVTASDGSSGGNVSILWYGVSGATHYEVYRSTSEGGAKTLLGTSSNTLFSDLSPVQGVTYYYWVKACDSALSDCSDFSDYNRGGAIPLIPAGLAASDGTSKTIVVVTWEPVTATRYQVYRGGAYLGEISSTTFYDSSAEPYRFYHYQVKACNYDLDSQACSNLSSGDDGWRKIDWPHALSASDGAYTTTVRVSWEAVNGAALYKVYRGTSTQPEDSVYIGQTAELWYEDDSAAPGTNYNYFAKACSSIDCGDYSYGDGGYRAVPPPQNVSASDGDYVDRVLVGWDDLPGADGFTVIRRASPDPGSFPYSGCSAAAGETSCEVDVAVGDRGRLFYFWVVAQAGVMSSDYSAYDMGGTPPDVPTNLEVSERYEEIAIGWWGADFASHYQIWRAESMTETKTLVASPADDTFPYADTTAVPMQAYDYWIKSCNSFSCSAFSQSIQAMRPLEIPDLVQASYLTHTDMISVTWNYSGPAEFFEVYRALEYEGAYEYIGQSSANGYADGDVVPGWSYSYKIKSCNSLGCSDFSFPENGMCAMPPPDNVWASDGTFREQVQLTWMNVPGASYYQIFCSDNAGGVEYNLCGTNAELSFEDAPEPGKTYFYGVKACQNGPAGCSELSLVDDGWRAMPYPLFTASRSAYNDRVVLAWDALPEAKNYKVWRATSPDGVKSELSYQSALGYNDFDVLPGTLYFYWLQACNDFLCSDYGPVEIGGIDIFQVFLPVVFKPYQLDGDY